LDGPVLVLAGAGTGKTRVLITRLAHILATGRAFPGQNLAVTFTNKAAREMFERVEGLVGASAQGLWLGTFHAIGVRILRRHAELVGLKPSFTILDTDDQIRLAKQVLEAADIDEKKWPARALVTVIQRWKDKGLAPGKVPASAASEFANGRALELYRHYQERLRTLNAADFGDLLLHSLTLFTENPEVLADYQRRFRYILVDEYQDSNVAQYLWLRLLAQGGGNICCVGDDDQSIYGWRGAEVGNILRFEKDFAGARIVRLERNYRSTPHILAAASGLIAHNEGRLGKTLWTEGEDGGKVVLGGVWDGAEEARMVADEIEALQRNGCRLDDIAILVRAGAQTREFEERFILLGIPYRVIGGLRFYERHEIRDAVAYLRVLAQPDDDLAFERIVNVPRRGIGKASLQTIYRLARADGIALTTAAGRLVETDEIASRARGSLSRLLDDFDRWRAQAQTMTPSALAEGVLDEAGYTGMWRNDRSADAPGRLENLKEFVAALEDFESVQEFLEHVSLVMDHDQAAGGDLVNVMTLHSGKGLEFDTVFLPGWEEGLFPHTRALDESGHAGLEEERRLAYVGITRARKQVRISFAANRRLFNQWVSAIPSRFIDELPPDHVERLTSPGLYAGRGAGRQGKLDAGLSEMGTAFADLRARARRGRVIDVKARKLEAAKRRGAGAVGVGDRVFHQKFGYGRILAIELNKLEIIFEKAGIKKVIDSFVDPA
ncbi:MAG: UvrD-helicase domain-containing protein, partial [Alphaproteobacteria bacterium]|nr:UvrD-helicase domain-containing protein [Alphaproteobacteria bacterium]